MFDEFNAELRDIDAEETAEWSEALDDVIKADGPERARYPYFDLEGLQVWGATAMILGELTALLE